eukprot:s1566_g8.t1
MIPYPKKFGFLQEELSRNCYHGVSTYGLTDVRGVAVTRRRLGKLTKRLRPRGFRGAPGPVAAEPRRQRREQTHRG